jgi:His-Xaa-Ser system protein HxsD
LTKEAVAASDTPAPFQLVYDTDAGQVSFPLHESLFCLDAIYGASYLFIDRCWLFLSRPDEDSVVVHLKPKTATDQDGLDAIAGEFANELLNQSIRVRLSESTKSLREYYMARAFFTTPVQSSIDALLAELDAEELEDDELEISVPWEENNAE